MGDRYSITPHLLSLLLLLYFWTIGLTNPRTYGDSAYVLYVGRRAVSPHPSVSGRFVAASTGRRWAVCSGFTSTGQFLACCIHLLKIRTR